MIVHTAVPTVHYTVPQYLRYRGTYGTYGTMVPYSLDLFYPGIQVTRIVKLR